MQQDKEKTRVIFRTFKGKDGGDVIALFPHFTGNNTFDTCGSYQHIGQHGSANPYHVMRMTRPATEAEYSSLKVELEGLGYNLELKRRTSYHDYKIRCLALGAV